MGGGVPMLDAGVLASALLDTSNASKLRYDDAGDERLDLKTLTKTVATDPHYDLGGLGQTIQARSERPDSSRWVFDFDRGGDDDQFNDDD